MQLQFCPEEEGISTSEYFYHFEKALLGSFNYGDPKPYYKHNFLTGEYAVALVNKLGKSQILPLFFWPDAGWFIGYYMSNDW